MKNHIKNRDVKMPKAEHAPIGAAVVTTAGIRIRKTAPNTWTCGMCDYNDLQINNLAASWGVR